MSSIGYFDKPEVLKPLLHTWSLAVEEQFYIFTPFLLFFLRGRPFVQLAAVAAVTIASLSANLFLVMAKSQTDLAFFHSGSRIWEIGAGVCFGWIAVFAPRSLPVWVKYPCGLLIALCLVFASAGSRTLPLFTLAIVITTGIALMSDRQGQVRDPFSIAPLPLIGKISYGLYLWHWPLIVFGNIAFPGDLYTIAAVTCVGSFAAASISFYYLEHPIRNRKFLQSRASLSFALAAVTSLQAGVAVGYWRTDGVPSRLPSSVAMARTGIDDKNLRWAECFAPENWERANIERLDVDRPCLLGNERQSVSFMLIGDSHANAIMPLFDHLAKTHSMHGAAALYSGCPPLVGLEHVFEIGRTCARFVDAAIRYAERHDIRYIYLAGYWNHYLRAHLWDGVHPIVRPSPLIRLINAPAPQTTEEVDAVFATAMNDTLTRLAGRQVIILGQVPQQKFSIPQMLAQGAMLGRSPERIERTAADVIKMMTPSREAFLKAARLPSVTFVDPVKVLCTDRCKVEDGGRPLYYDDNHLSAFGAEFLAQLIEPTFKQAAAQPSVSTGARARLERTDNSAQDTFQIRMRE